MSNNRDLSKVLESLKDLEQKTASAEEISVLKELLGVTITSVVEIANQNSIISKALQKENQLLNKKVGLNREAIDQIIQTLSKLFGFHLKK
tara:strand:- start:296 stop:568 length:273 start_codon:yes stop_codon:yes gene_type:complete